MGAITKLFEEMRAGFTIILEPETDGLEDEVKRYKKEHPNDEKTANNLDSLVVAEQKQEEKIKIVQQKTEREKQSEAIKESNPWQVKEGEKMPVVKAKKQVQSKETGKSELEREERQN